MKALLSALILLGCSIAHADTITLNDTLCGTGTATCSNPAPSVSLLTYSPLYGRLTATIDGVQYLSTEYGATSQGGIVYAADGSSHVVETVFATWRTCTRTGRGQMCLTHWELKSGTVQ